MSAGQCTHALCVHFRGKKKYLSRLIVRLGCFEHPFACLRGRNGGGRGFLRLGIWQARQRQNIDKYIFIANGNASHYGVSERKRLNLARLELKWAQPLSGFSS